MNVIRRVLLLTLLVALAGCSGDDDIYLRVRNASSADYSSVRVRFPSVEVNYGTVEAGGTSGYRKLATAYRYGYVEVESVGDTYRLTPVDYVGEEPLEAGHYTFSLDLYESGLRLTFEAEASSGSGVGGIGLVAPIPPCPSRSSTK
ncbi:MAG: hypothetical protein KDA27_15130 [Candidatus Eisenbacteria bacterium]|uniref:DUF4382 domain-containing protein n=1 Tax=Eiseniibacteriota bacterium TaxID=2212470 RepID=A0A956NDT4_UNCEI|nr:hypothetical protein [Candidatus Eisenbacteria bacterium]MCB9466582.1 hypothetical protein [Candidatus Eisenbacteria bacterium]